MIEKVPGSRRLSIPSHRPSPAGPQGPGTGGPGAIPEGKLDREPEALPRRHRGGGAGRGNRPGVREAGRRAQKQPQDSGLHYDAACAYALASQAIARKDLARRKPLSERASACSARQSRTATPITSISRRTPTSIQYGNVRHSPRSCRPGIWIARTQRPGWAISGSSRASSSVSTRPFTASGAANS